MESSPHLERGAQKSLGCARENSIVKVQASGEVPVEAGGTGRVGAGRRVPHESMSHHHKAMVSSGPSSFPVLRVASLARSGSRRARTAHADEPLCSSGTGM